MNGSNKSAYRHTYNHPLGSKNGDECGWVESLSGLQQGDEATKLVVQDPEETLHSHSSAVIELENSEDESRRMFLRELSLQVGKCGEAVLELGATESSVGPVCETEEELEKLLDAIEVLSKENGFVMTVLRKQSVTGCKPACDVCVRREVGSAPPLEIRVAVIGNVDSGKSTMVGVLTRGILDDGRGKARATVFKHNHESSTGRTSAIGQHNLCLNAEGVALNDAAFKTANSGEYIARAAKVVTLVDLAGHEKYFKTTAFGLTGHLPDYSCLIIGANAGIVGMCKEHLGISLALRIPAFFVVTKIDLAPQHVLQHTITTLQSILKKPGVKKKPILVKTRDDVIMCAKHIHSNTLAPIFLTSCVTGQGLDLVKLFFNLLQERFDWAERAANPAEFLIDETFSVPGVGTVVAGTVKQGVITTNTPILLGPDIGNGSFTACGIKSIHYKRLPVERVVAGQSASFCLKKIKRSQVRKGMALVSPDLKPAASWEFDADIAILTHATTIRPRYTAVIHCEIVRQSARLICIDCKDVLRSGSRAVVRFRFLSHPEYLTLGSRFVFREGKTKGIGVIVGTEAQPANQNPVVSP